MILPLSPLKLFEASFVFLICTCSLHAQSVLSELKAEQNPQRRSEKALIFADAAFDSAHELYLKGEIDKGDAELDNMTKALDQCVESLTALHKGRYYKRAEMNVANLQRRLEGVLSDLSVQKRGWAEYTSRKLDEIHDKLLIGVMSK